MPIINRIADYQDDLTAWRRHLHAHPELGFEEHETARFVAAKLREFGVDEIHEGIAGTGVVAVIRGGASDRAIGLRADMDALPIQEDTGLPWASKTPGRMHACGHDGHTTMLLGAARYLAETRAFDGTVYLLFQPAEEGLGGGRRMVEEGVFERFAMSDVYGMHNWPYLPVGEFAICEGPAMAAADKFEIVLEGQGCHAAFPHTGRDPLVAAAAIVQSLQTIVSRKVDPLDNAVVSVTGIHGGDTFNVVPALVTMMGTVRTFRKQTQAMIEQRMRAIVEGIAGAHEITGSLKWMQGYPPTVNHPRETAIAGDVAASIVGEDKVDRAPQPTMGAEDFAFMLEQRPGSYIWMGQGGAEAGRILHSPFYDFNDEALAYGVSYWARLVEEQLPRAAAA